MINELDTNYHHSLEDIYNETSKKLLNLPWENKDFYAHWLAQTFFMVSHTPRLICLAAARFSPQEDSLHRKMVDHFSDEDKHEYVILEDLKNLGYTLEEFEENPETALIIQQLYYQIDHIDPIAIFGRILFLELLSAELDLEFHQRFANSYEKNQTQFMKIHLEEDVEHVQKAAATLKTVPMNKRKLIGDAFYMTGFLYQQFMEGILKTWKSSSRQEKAA